MKFIKEHQLIIGLVILAIALYFGLTYEGPPTRRLY